MSFNYEESVGYRLKLCCFVTRRLRSCSALHERTEALQLTEINPKRTLGAIDTVVRITRVGLPVTSHPLKNYDKIDIFKSLEIELLLSICTAIFPSQFGKCSRCSAVIEQFS